MSHFLNSEIGKFQVNVESQISAFQEYSKIGNFKIQLYQHKQFVCESLLNLHPSQTCDFVFKKENLQMFIFYRDQTLIVADLELSKEEKTIHLKVILKSKIEIDYSLGFPTANPQLIIFSKEVENNGPGEYWKSKMLKVGQVEGKQIRFKEFYFDTWVSVLDIQSINNVLVLVDEENIISLTRISLA